MLTLGVGVALFLAQLYLWARFHVHIPVTDQAYILPLVQTVVERGFGSTSMDDWISPASGAHRIAVTRLLMSADYLFLNGQNHLLYFSTWASIVTLLAVILTSFRRGFGSDGGLALFVAGMTLAFLSSRSQLWNVVNPINSSWYITFAASALGIACITNRPHPPTAWQIFAAYSLAAVAAFSTFSGILVWLILPLFIALRSTRTGIVSALASAVFLTLYLSGISTDLTQNPGNPQATELARYLPSEPIPVSKQRLHMVTAVSTNTLAFLGSPLSITNPKLSSLVVIASLLMLVASWLWLLRSWYAGRPDHNAWIELNLAIATLCVGTATAANLGRIILSTPTADRYQTIVMMYWLSICGLILGFGLGKHAVNPAKEHDGVAAWQLGSMALCTALSILFLSNASFPVTTTVKLSEAANRAAALDALGISGRYVSLSAWRSGYLNDFHEFFERYALAHRVREDLQLPISNVSTDCPHAQLLLTPTEWPGIVFASATIEEDWVRWNRKVPVTTEQGNVMGHLFPVYKQSKTGSSPFFLPISDGQATWTRRSSPMGGHTSIIDPSR